MESSFNAVGSDKEAHKRVSTCAGLKLDICLLCLQLTKMGLFDPSYLSSLPLFLSLGDGSTLTKNKLKLFKHLTQHPDI